MNTRLKYYLYLCDEYAMRLLLGEDAIDREVKAKRDRWTTADYRRR